MTRHKIGSVGVFRHKWVGVRGESLSEASVFESFIGIL